MAITVGLALDRPARQILFPPDEFAALGHLEPGERAMSLMARNPLFVRHAKEKVANAIDALPPGTSLSGRTLSVHV